MVSFRHHRQLSKEPSTFSTLFPLDDSVILAVSIACADLEPPLSLVNTVLSRSGRNDMFKISTVNTPKERRLIVEGTLVKPWVAELRRTWSEASLESRNLVIDLTNATTIDSEGEEAIFDLMQDGAKFCCSGVLNKHVLKQLAQKCHSLPNSAAKRTRSEQEPK